MDSNMSLSTNTPGAAMSSSKIPIMNRSTVSTATTTITNITTITIMTTTITTITRKRRVTAG